MAVNVDLVASNITGVPVYSIVNTPENNSEQGGNATDCQYTIDNIKCISKEEYLNELSNYIFPSPFEWCMIILFIVVFFVGLIGNLLVCYAVWRNPHLRTVTNYFIVNLAVADFMVILICLPPTLLGDVTETWYMGRIMCKIIVYFQGVSVQVSVLTLTAISLERWYAICHPLSFKATTARARFIIISIWVFSLGLMAPELYSLETKSDLANPEISPLLTLCRPSWSKEKQVIYQSFLMVVLYFIPLLLMSIFYTNIVLVLWRQDIPTECTGSRNSEPSSAGSQQLAARRKAARMLIVVVVMFGVCYLPVHALNIMSYSGLRFQYMAQFAMFSHWACYFNSAINPVIYNFMSAKFRKEFKHACACCLCLCHATHQWYRDFSYYYRYTETMSKTEAVTLTTLNTKGAPDSD